MPKPNKNRRRSYSGEYMALAKWGEDVTQRWLQGQPGIQQVTDVREEPDYQAKDVDFLFEYRGKQYGMEVKTDEYIGNPNWNLVFEYGRVYHTCDATSTPIVQAGWSVKSNADRFAFFAPAQECLYIMRANEYRQRFQQYTREKRDQTNRRWIPTDKIKSTLIVLLPEGYWRDIAKEYNVSMLITEDERIRWYDE